MTNKLQKAINRVNNLLDRYVLPLPVRFLTFRFVILLTMALLIPLIIYADQIKLVLAVNSYLNVMSVAVSSIVLLYATISEARQKQIADLTPYAEMVVDPLELTWPGGTAVVKNKLPQSKAQLRIELGKRPVEWTLTDTGWPG